MVNACTIARTLVVSMPPVSIGGIGESGLVKGGNIKRTMKFITQGNLKLEINNWIIYKLQLSLTLSLPEHLHFYEGNNSLLIQLCFLGHGFNCFDSLIPTLGGLEAEKGSAIIINTKIKIALYLLNLLTYL